MLTALDWPLIDLIMLPGNINKLSQENIEMIRISTSNTKNLLIIVTASFKEKTFCLKVLLDYSNNPSLDYPLYIPFL